MCSVIRGRFGLEFLLMVCLSFVGIGYGQNGRQILDATGVKGGLIVHVDCGDGGLTAALHANESYLVHGLDTDASDIEKARDHIRSLGLYGVVSVRKWDGRALAYADNMVNLVVSENADRVPEDEIMRVLRPLGVAYLKSGGKWTKTTKPWPADIDEWTHWLHSADGNAVARDRVVGPPRQIQWAAAPLWARHHDTVPSMSAMVSARGRLFYISDEAPPGLDGSFGDKWFLVARDAFNGVLLWKRSMPEWGWTQWNTEWKGRFNMPPHMPKRIVAVGDRLYATLNFNAPLTALDAATGEILYVYEGTGNTDEILYEKGLLILSVNEETRKPDKANKSPVKKSVCVIDADSGRQLWRKGGYSGLRAKYDSSEPFGRLELIAGDGQVFFVDHDAIISLDLKSGQEKWRVERPQFEEQLRMYSIRMSDQCVLVYQDGVILFAQPEMDKMRSWHTLPGTLYAYNAKDGEFLWKHQYGGWSHNWQPDVFVVDGLVWVHEHIDVEMKRHEPDTKEGIDYAVIGLDLRTGRLKRRFSTAKTNKVDHHHRCYRGKATERYLLPSRRGVEFLDLETEENLLHHWARGGCLHGFVPCNGLIYLNPNPCECYIETKLNGYYALAQAGQRKIEDQEPSAQFERGPAYKKIESRKSKIENPTDWPTFRHDPLRSGSTTASISEKLKPSWRVPVGSRITPPVAVGDKVFISSIDEHTVTALDANSGRVIWNFTAGGRVDTPPTIYKGLVLFGSMDGWAYCLREADGQLAWRRRVAPRERLVGAYGQIESAWPIHGGILVKDDVAYLSAGRSSYLDGGIILCAINPVAGVVIDKRTLYSPDPQTDEMPLPTVHRKIIPGALSDILVSDGSSVFMRQEKVFGDDSAAKPHVFSTAGFRDDAWFNRTQWAIGAVSGAQLVVFDDKIACGIVAYSGGNRAHSYRPDGSGYELFAGRWKEQVPRKPATDSSSKSKKKKKFEPLWKRRAAVSFTAMVLAGRRLFAAGPPDVVDPKDPLAALEGRKGAKLWIVSAGDGQKLADYQLDSPPVFDGMAVTDGRLYISLKDGTIACFKGH
jgi:outer membrane protein assembly factor BamB